MQFDEYATNYKELVDKSSGVSVERLAAEKARLITAVLDRFVGNPAELTVLDIGCGIGLIDRPLEGLVKALHGIDMSSVSVEYAKKLATRTQFYEYDGKVLPFESNHFDGAFASCVLHHVAPDQRRSFVREMMRVIRPGGVAIFIEHNPLNPVTRKIVSSCVFDADAILLGLREAMTLLVHAGASRIGRRFMGFSPIRTDAIERAEAYLGWLPIGAQYSAWGTKTVPTKDEATA
jgi:ubiquinone/menaquinone biosynthesis C-methylase UbiE